MAQLRSGSGKLEEADRAMLLKTGPSFASVQWRKKQDLPRNQALDARHEGRRRVKRFERIDAIE